MLYKILRKIVSSRDTFDNISCCIKITKEKCIKNKTLKKYKFYSTEGMRNMLCLTGKSLIDMLKYNFDRSKIEYRRSTSNNWNCHIIHIVSRILKCMRSIENSLCYKIEKNHKSTCMCYLFEENIMVYGMTSSLCVSFRNM